MKRKVDKIDRVDPPAWARKLLQMVCSADLFEELDGDLLEEYKHQLKIIGSRRASVDYVINVLSFIRPLSKSRKPYHKTTTTLSTVTMWRSYVLTAARNFSRHKTYTSLNLAGLTLGLICSMLIFQFVTFEKSADDFHNDRDHLYRVVFRLVSGGGTPETVAQIYLGAGEAFKTEVPGVEEFTRIRADFFQEGPTISYTASTDNIALKDIRSLIVDSSFFNMFTFPLIRGDRRSIMALPNSILITESTAARIFGDVDPIGKTLDYSMNQGVQSFRVSGVLKDTPANSHIQFDVIIPLQHYLSNIPEAARQYYSEWNFREFTTYVELQQGNDVSRIERMMSQVVNKKIGEDLRNNNVTLNVQLQPLKSVYFDRTTDLGLTGFGSAIVATRTGNQKMVYFFSIIAIITLAIALMSYINLSTVRSLDRAKEVGIRKVVGAHKCDLKYQFFLESVMMNFAALVLAIIVVMLVMPSFNDFFNTNFTWNSWFNKTFMLVFGTVFISGVLLSGLYPAFILSSFMPIAALKGKVGFTSGSGMRKVFVVLQYAPAIVLLVCTFVIYDQLHFMRTMDVGLKMDKLITIRSPRILPEAMRSADAEHAFRTELKNLPMIAAASFAGNQAGRGLNFLVPFENDSTGEPGVNYFKGSGIDHEFASVFGLNLLAGQPFTEGMAAAHDDPDKFIRKVMVNETAVRKWGFKRNTDAVGHIVRSMDGSQYYVHAVLEDFNWSSVHRATEPVMLWYTPNNRFMTIRLASAASTDEALTQIGAIYNKLFPSDVFHYEFADDVYNKQYAEDEKFTNLFGVFSGMALIIASLGLFGLSAFSAARRSREVGIRKVMGANVHQIIGLLSKEFMLLVFIAFVIASPIAWFVMDGWLRSFAFRVDLNAIPFVVTAIGSFLIALITVSVKSNSVAHANPVKALRSE